MKKLITITTIGAAIGVAAIAGGAGVALAHGDHGNMDDHATTMNSATMQMDPASMQEHMRQVFGDDTYQRMQEAMKQALGETGYQEMAERMAAGCTADMGSMMTGSTDTSSVPGHDSHHPSSGTPGTN